MKYLKLILLVCITTVVILKSENSFAQQVNKNYVVVEIGTGTWCQYCPGAAMGADDLVNNGHDVAIIENHNGDPYAYAGSNARNSYYNITGYPTAYFDGGNPVVGGSHTVSSYPSYLLKYNAAIAVLSDFTLDMTYTHTGLDYDVAIDIDEVGNYAGTNLVIHLALTESHIEENWQGMTELNFVSRAMYPDQNGTAFTGGATTLNLSFTADSSWDLSNGELVAFIQDNSTKEILQSDKISLAQPTGVNNIAILSVNEIKTTCDLLVSPSLKVKNFGSADITSLDIDWSINGGNSSGTFLWTGDPITLFDQTNIYLDDLAFTQLNATNPIEFEITQVNGVSDDDTTNNTASDSFDIALTSADDYIHVFVQTDDHGEECTWTIEDSTGTIVESGGPYGNNENINVYLSLSMDCYTFTIFDSAGNGGGTVVVVDQSTPLYYSEGDYGAEDSQEFSTPNTQDVDEIAFAQSSIFPNPANTTLNVENAIGLNVSIIDILGRELFIKGNISESEQIDVSNLSEGTYLIKLSDGINQRTEKIVIRR